MAKISRRRFLKEASATAVSLTILGRKAAYEKRRVTWEELLKDEERLEPNLSGLKE